MLTTGKGWPRGLKQALTITLSAAALLNANMALAAMGDDDTSAIAQSVASESPLEVRPVARQVAQAVSLNMQGGSGIVTGTSDQPTTTSANEKIEVTFQESERDILTKQADQKLDIMVDSLEFANADLRNVIRIIGERLNLNFIFDSGDIDGKVTLRLRNIRLRDALNSILVTRKLAIVADRSGIFRIVPQEQIGRHAIETRTDVIQLNWINAADVLKSMRAFLSEDVGKMEANDESNSIIITDVPPHIETIRKLIGQIDIPERQVQLEARLVDINIGAVRDLSSNFTASKVNKHWQDGTVYVKDINGTTGAPTLGAATIPFVDTLGVVNNLLSGLSMNQGKGTLALGDTLHIFGSEYNLNAVFKALETRNVVEILANPRVTTLNNVPTQISIVEKIPYVQAVAGPSQGTLTQQVEFENAGVDITAKPIITPNGYVRMEIKLKQSIFRERVGGGALDPPAIDERIANTSVIVPDQNTVVLGGLRQARRLEGIEGLPWIHRIPLIGWMFKNKNYDQSKTELLLMMTPTIIAEKVTLTEREQTLYKKIDTDWNLPDYFFDDTKQESDLNSPPSLSR